MKLAGQASESLKFTQQVLSSQCMLVILSMILLLLFSQNFCLICCSVQRLSTCVTECVQDEWMYSVWKKKQRLNTCTAEGFQNEKYIMWPHGDGCFRMRSTRSCWQPCRVKRECGHNVGLPTNGEWTHLAGVCEHSLWHSSSKSAIGTDQGLLILSLLVVTRTLALK